MLRVIAALLMVSGCVTPAQMDESPPQKAVHLNVGYQQAFASLNRGMRNCEPVALARVDGQLMPDLGYGEVISYISGSLSASAIYSAKVQKAGNGTRLEMKSSALKSMRHHHFKWIEYWANGGTRCHTLTYAENPHA